MLAIVTALLTHEWVSHAVLGLHAVPQKSVLKWFQARGLEATGSASDNKARMNAILDREFAAGECRHECCCRSRCPHACVCYGFAASECGLEVPQGASAQDVRRLLHTHRNVVTQQREQALRCVPTCGVSCVAAGQAISRRCNHPTLQAPRC